MDIELIKKYLPHRIPFLMVDRVLTYNQGKSIQAIKNITANDTVFQGHFPDQAVYPGVLVIEAMAQASGLLGYLCTDSDPDSDLPLYVFAGIDKARFKRIIVPGDQLLIKVEFLQSKNDFTLLKTACTVTVDGELVCSGQILLMKKPG
jgi:3-hydroxyacyl-[acyl-carrier-protein] dehydratase